MELGKDLVNLLDEYFESKKDKTPLFRVGTVDPTYAGVGFPKIRFDGDADYSDKEFSFLKSYYPSGGDRIILMRVQNTYVIVGNVLNPDNSSGTNTPPSGGGGGSVAWADVTGKPSAFTPTSHTHSWTEITSKPTTFSPSAHTHDWSEVTGKPTAFTPTTHSHTTADVTGLDTALAGKASTTHSHSWTEITSKPTTFTPSTHTHIIADVTGLQTALDGKASTSHTHTVSNITDFPSQTGNSGKYLSTNGTSLSWVTAPTGGSVAWADITGKPTTFTPATHTHAISDVTGLQTALDGKEKLARIPVHGCTPQAVDELNSSGFVVTIENRWTKMANTGYRTFDWYHIDHVRRYLKFEFEGKMSATGQTMYVRIMDESGATQIASANMTGTAITAMNITADLGTATGNPISIEVDFRTTATTSTAYLRLKRAYLTDTP